MKMSKYEEYENYVEELWGKIDAMIRCYEATPRNMPSQSVLQYEEDDGTQLQVSKKQLKAKREELQIEVCRNLLKKFKQAGKRRRKADPSDFTGAYTPVSVDIVIRKFIELVDFGHTDPTDPTSPKLMDALPSIKRSYGLRNSFQLLWYIAIYHNRLQDESDKTMLVPNEAMKEAFGNYPCTYTNYIDDDGKIKTKDNDTKMTTFDALEYRTTVLDKKETPFDRNRIHLYTFPIILSINIFKTSNLSEKLREGLKREDIRAQLLNEYNIIKETKDKWKEYLKVLRSQPSS